MTDPLRDEFMADLRKLSDMPKLPLLGFLETTWPDCFNWQEPRPLKLNIHLDMLPTVLAAGYTEEELGVALRQYIRRPCYQYVLAMHSHRVDLSGTPHEPVRLEHRPAPANCSAPILPKLPAYHLPAGQPEAQPPTLTPQDIEDLIAMAIPARMEVVLKFSELPMAKETPKGATFALKTENKTVVVQLPTKAWKKLVKANEEWLQWIAALTGKIGEPLPTGDGFFLENPALQVFEKRPKPAAGPPTGQTGEVAARPEPPPPPAAKPVPVVTIKKRLVRW